MNRIARLALLACGVLAGAIAPIARAQDNIEAADEPIFHDREQPTPTTDAPPIRMRIALTPPLTRLQVGTPVTIRITLTNTTDGILRLPDFGDTSDVIQHSLQLQSFPGSSNAPWYSSTVTYNAAGTKPFRELPPGVTIVERTLEPLIPGRGTIAVTLANTQTSYTNESGESVEVADPWTGRLTARIKVMVKDELPPAAVARYEQVKATLLSGTGTPDDRARLLASVANDRHIYAARFIAERTADLPAGPERDLAVAWLAHLLELGTAYEHVATLAELAENEAIAPLARVAAARALVPLTSGRGYDLAGHATFEPPEATTKQIRELLDRLRHSNDPLVAAMMTQTATRQKQHPWDQ